MGSFPVYQPAQFLSWVYRMHSGELFIRSNFEVMLNDEENVTVSFSHEIVDLRGKVDLMLIQDPDAITNQISDLRDILYTTISPQLKEPSDVLTEIAGLPLCNIRVTVYGTNGEFKGQVTNTTSQNSNIIMN